MGIDWQEYAAHPEQLRTCMWCKLAQRSVMTEEQAMVRFPALKGRGDVFVLLRKEGRGFHVNGTMQYWHADMDARAELDGRAPPTACGAKEEVLTPEKPTRKQGRVLSESPHDPEDPRPRTRHRPRDPAAGTAAQSPGPVAASAAVPGGPEGPWRYFVTGGRRLGIREGPDVEAAPSPAGHLAPGSVFLVCERLLAKDGRTYLRLADGRGWTYDRSSKDLDRPVVKELAPGEEAAVLEDGPCGAGRQRKAARKERKAASM